MFNDPPRSLSIARHVSPPSRDTATPPGKRMAMRSLGRSRLNRTCCREQKRLPTHQAPKQPNLNSPLFVAILPSSDSTRQLVPPSELDLIEPVPVLLPKSVT